MPGKQQTDAVTLDVAVRRYFDVLLYLLIFTGFGTLASTGRLDLPTVLLVTGALLFRGYWLARRHQVLLSEKITNLLTVACVGFFIADEFIISGTFIDATIHLVLFVMLVRMFSAQRDRDHYFLAVLSFLMVLAAAVLTVDSTFLFALCTFVLVAVAVFILMEMMHSIERSPVLARDPNVFRAYRKLSFAVAGTACVLLLLIFAGGFAIFFFLPRVSAGYLSAYTGANDLTTGFSDRVDLGRIGQIQQSKTVVMHVQVDGDTAGTTSLKLRGVALNDFDGHSWSNTREKITRTRDAAGRFNLSLQDSQRPQGRVRNVHYRVTMEPFLNEVFFLLATPRSLQGNYRAVSEDTAGDVFDFDSEHPVNRYEADSQLSESPVLDIGTDNYPADVAASYLQLPQMDPRVPALADEITRKVPTSRAKAAAIESYLRGRYGYTLQLPSVTPKDPIADFLFVRRKGHCEYFASSMAVMLRTIGIPSRVVNGFAGGEFNDLTSQYVIRASNAHSWVEAYIPGEGWMAFDPTPAAAVAPQTEWGRLMLYMDAMSSFWREWVVNYDLSHQLRLSQDASRGSRALVRQAQSWTRRRYEKILSWARAVEEHIGHSSVMWGLRIVILAAVAIFIFSVPRLLFAINQFRAAYRPEKAPGIAASIWYGRMLRIVAGRGWQKAPAQTPAEFVASIPDEELKKRISVFTTHYENARFGRSSGDASQLPELYEEIKHNQKLHA